MSKLLDKLQKLGQARPVRPMSSKAPVSPRPAARVAPKLPEVPALEHPVGARPTPSAIGVKPVEPLVKRLVLDAKGNLVGKQPPDFDALSHSQKVQAITEAQNLHRQRLRQAFSAKIDHARRQLNAGAERKRRSVATGLASAQASLHTLLTQPHHSPLARKGLALGVGYAVLSKLFSGQDAKAQDPEMQQVATAANASVPSNIKLVNNIILQIDAVNTLLGDDEHSAKVKQVLAALKASFVPLASGLLQIDSPGAVSSFVTAVQNAEAAVASFFEKSDTIGQALGDPPQYQELLSGLGEFLLEVNDMRAKTVSASKADLALKYATIYQNSLVKTAFLPALIPWAVTSAFMISGAMNMAAGKAVELNQLKGKLQEMQQLIASQKGTSGAEKYQKTFDDYGAALKVVVDNIDPMLKSPTSDKDGSQLQAMQKFVESANHLLYKGSEVSGALTNMQSIWGDIGDMFQYTGLNFGWQPSDLAKFNTLLSSVQNNLTLLTNDITTGLEKLKVQAQAVTPQAAPASGSAAEQIANITL